MMQYEIERCNDPSFFAWLSALGPQHTGMVHTFNKAVVCGFASFDVLETWLSDREYLIPDLPDAPSSLVYFMTSEGKRVFVAFVYGHEQRALLAEITMLQLPILPAGVRTVSGKRFFPPTHAIICAPADDKPISREFISQSPGAYIAMHEIDPPTNGFSSVSANTDSAPQRKWLRFDMGHPLLAASHINTHAGLLSLAQPGIGSRP